MMSVTSNRRRFRLACRTVSFLISLYIFALNLSSPAIFVISDISTSKNTTEEVLSSFNSIIDEFMEITTPKPQWTLAHYDPHFMGGFRNQHMRFVAFVNKAVEHNISQILLPSLRWGDVSQPGKSAPHELLFDVIYWNKRCGEFGLPRLVRYEADILEQSGSGEGNVTPCFNVESSMYSGLDEKKWRTSAEFLRKNPIWGHLPDHCKIDINKHAFDVMGTSNKTLNGPMTYLIPHGGSQSGGRLWWEYDGMQRHRTKPDESTGKYPDHLPQEQAIYKILVPSFPIRRAIKKSLEEAVGTSKPNVLALHPRIEHDMMLHQICSKFMESNLTKIFESISALPKFDLMFVAVSKALVDGPPPNQMHRLPELLRIANENRIVLNQTRYYGVFGTNDHRGIPILESGTSTASKIQFPVMEQGNHNGSTYVTAKSLGVTELVASIVNFFTALEGNAFVGVKGSTYSQDIFSVRYYQHNDRGEEGANNFVMGPDGIKELVGPSEPLPCK